MANERNTEQLTLKAFEAVLGQNDRYELFAQKIPSEFTLINQALSETGGKPEICEIEDFSKGGNERGMPEFIAVFSEDKDTIFICECKKETNFLQSTGLNKPKKYALDGVIYYAKFLQKYVNVIALAVAGTDINKIKTRALYFPKSLHNYDEIIFDRTKDIILSPLNYLKLLN